MAPPTTSEWPLMYLVVECKTAVAPSASGRCRTGEANVLSTTSGIARAPRQGSHGRYVDQPQHRIGGRLEPDQLGRGPKPGLDVGGGAHVDEADLDAEGPDDSVEEAVGSTVDVVSADDVVPGAQGIEQRGRGSAAAAEGECHLPALEGCQSGLERRPRGIAAAGVVVAERLTGLGLGKGARQHDRLHHRAVHRVGLLPAMNGDRLDTRRPRRLPIAHAAPSR